MSVKACLSVEIQEGMTYAETLRLTQTAEAGGFDAALVAEHYAPSGVAERYGAGGRALRAVGSGRAVRRGRAWLADLA